jgi:hypothetical protein
MKTREGGRKEKGEGKRKEKGERRQYQGDADRRRKKK